MGPDLDELRGAAVRRRVRGRTDCRAKRAEWLKLAEAGEGTCTRAWGAQCAAGCAKRTDRRAQRAELAEACGGWRGN